MIKVHTLKYVNFTDLCKGSEDFYKASVEAKIGESYTLVTQDKLKKILDKVETVNVGDDQIQKLHKQLLSLDDNVFIFIDV